MRKSFIKALVFVAGALLSVAACAVSLGNINVTTGLGEPLSAEIDLPAISKAEKSNLSAHLASPDIFKGAGMDYPSALPKLNFQIETRANGAPYIKVTTDQPVNEPFVSILVELSWSSGRLLREYTFLLDPPGFKPEQPKPAEVKPVLSRVEAPGQPAAPGPVSAVAAAEAAFPPMRMAAPVDEKLPVAALAPAAKLSEKALPSASVPTGSIEVKRGDTLGKIANEIKPADISLERMLVALYNANTDAFDGRNMNRLRTGKILRMPQGDELAKVGQAEAQKEIRMQAADWHDYRQKLAAASGTVAEHAPSREASGKIRAVVAEKTPPAKESAKEVVRLSKGEAPGDKAFAGGNARALQDKLHALEEEAVARNKTLKESNERIAMLEKNISDMQRLIELKTKAMAAAKPEAKPEAPKEAAAVPAVPVRPAASAAQAAKPAAATKAPVEPPSPLDQLLEKPLYLAGGVAVLLALGGLVFMRVRRGKTIPASMREETRHIVAPVAPSPETGDFTRAAPAHAAPQTEDVDPVAEAELFLNFGRDAQAEEILKDALKSAPDNQRIRLKLLSIYAKRMDAVKFAPIAREVRDSGDQAAWAEAAEMGRKLEPGNPLYGGDGGAAATQAPAHQISPETTTETAPAPAPVELDFDLDFGTPAASAAPHVDMPLEAAAEGAAAALDMEVGQEAAAQEPATAAPEERTLASTSVLDFDLGQAAQAVPQAAAEPAAPEEKKLAFTSVLDFDLGQAEQPAPEAAAQEAAPEPAAPEEKKLASTSVLDFDLGFEPPAPAPAPAAQEDHSAAMKPEAPLDIELAGELAAHEAQPAPQAEEPMFDVTEAAVTPAMVAEEVATAEASAEETHHDEFVLDFPVEEEAVAEEKAATEPARTAAQDEAIPGLGEINLNLEQPAKAQETRNQQWYDVATKLDLARAYHEMGDAAGAREILEEVLNEGDAQQRETAQAMIQQLS